MVDKRVSQLVTRKRPEGVIQDNIIAQLEARGWYVNPTHGNACQRGFPDLYCLHAVKGQRWIEVKNPLSWDFTVAQMKWYPIFVKCRIPVWVLMDWNTAALALLDGPPNLEHVLLRKAHGLK